MDTVPAKQSDRLFVEASWAAAASLAAAKWKQKAKQRVGTLSKGKEFYSVQ